ncbi:MAG: hypothetical protein PHI23_01520, partial [Candidatus Peribacteraceae bacterium]|nr:hypothetical protein [Candidatus Peribacteraceae bacterium]
MTQRLRERLTLLLLAVLPFHALLVTAGTKLLLGPGHAPLAILALWKEALLGLILLLALLEGVRGRNFWRVDLIDGLIIGLLLLSFAVTAAVRVDVKTTLFGFKYDFLPLAAFLVVRRAPWSAAF